MKKETLIPLAAALGVFLTLFWDVAASNTGRHPRPAYVSYPLTLVYLFLMFHPHKWLIDSFLKKKKIFFYILGCLTWFAIATNWSVFWQGQYSNVTLRNYVFPIKYCLLYTFSATAIYYGYKGILLQWRYAKIQRQQAEAELKLLQSQVNPHFLFNTLNTIYEQMLVEPPQASEMLMQLADLMRYQIESGKKTEVPLRDEITFIENYLALEQKRLSDKIRTDFKLDITEPIDFDALKIPPMLFIPFIENAYKHGIDSAIENTISIYLGIKNKAISLKIDNKIPLIMQKKHSTHSGLDNVRRRLNLLFPDKHQLNISTENHVYSVDLSVKLGF
jgi:two-component system, LytTR family, sensor kinase